MRIANSLKRNYMLGESRKGLRATQFCALTASYWSSAAYNVHTAPESLSLKTSALRSRATRTSKAQPMQDARVPMHYHQATTSEEADPV